MSWAEFHDHRRSLRELARNFFRLGLTIPVLDRRDIPELFGILRMEKINAKGVVYALLPVVLLQFLSLVGAVDIIFFESTSQCSGSGFSFNGIATQTCGAVSASDGGSVLVTSADSGTQSQFFRNGACTLQVGTGTGNVCFVGGQFTGAFWSGSRRRSLLGEHDTTKCSSQMKPTGIVFAEDGTKGSWMLTSSDAAELHSQMQNVPEVEKMNWLKSRGATYKEF